SSLWVGRSQPGVDGPGGADVGLVFGQGMGVVVAAGQVGDEEIGVLSLGVGLGVQRGPDGRQAGVGHRPGRQAGAAVGVVGRHDLGGDVVPAAVPGGHPVPEVVVVLVAL